MQTRAGRDWLRRAATGVIALFAVGAAIVVVPAGPALAASAWVQVSVGNSYTCGIKSGRTLWCWGDNYFGNLGLGDRVSRTTPTQVGTATDWRQVAVGYDHACATTTGDSLYCWGNNVSGQLGLGALDGGFRLSPVQLSPLGGGWSSVTVGVAHTCARAANLAAYCWGRQGVTTAPAPTKVGTFGWLSITAGGYHTCGISASQRAYCWGDNTDGQLGLGDTSPRPAPVVLNSNTWTDLRAGTYHTCGVLSSGSGWCWGSNAHNKVATGAWNDRTWPTAIGSGHTTIAAGDNSTCGLRLGNVWCWGYNFWGQTGTGSSNVDVPAPSQLNLPPARAVSVAEQVGCAILSQDSSLWCWGTGDALGTGDVNTIYRVPQAVTG